MASSDPYNVTRNTAPATPQEPPADTIVGMRLEEFRKMMSTLMAERDTLADRVTFLDHHIALLGSTVGALEQSLEAFHDRLKASTAQEGQRSYR